eukprot:scaffold13002_cov125-Isochrysis_galbana.AAC.8
MLNAGVVRVWIALLHHQVHRVPDPPAQPSTLRSEVRVRAHGPGLLSARLRKRLVVRCMAGGLARLPPRRGKGAAQLSLPTQNEVPRLCVRLWDQPGALALGGHPCHPFFAHPRRSSPSSPESAPAATPPPDEDSAPLLAAAVAPLEVGAASECVTAPSERAPAILSEEAPRTPSSSRTRTAAAASTSIKM